jgi:hypothetical protein
MDLIERFQKRLPDPVLFSKLEEKSKIMKQDK